MNDALASLLALALIVAPLAVVVTLIWVVLEVLLEHVQDLAAEALGRARACDRPPVAPGSGDEHTPAERSSAAPEHSADPYAPPTGRRLRR